MSPSFVRSLITNRPRSGHPAAPGPSRALRRSLVVVLLLALFAPAAASADRLTVRGTQVFKSVVRDTPTQFGNELVAFNGFVYFVADDDVHGNELWRTDGTNEGTALVSDIYPGLPNTSSTPHRLTVAGDRLFFNAYNATTQSPETLYYIDAAAPTTVKLANARRVDNGSLTPAVGPIFGAPNGRVVIGRLLGEAQNCCYSVFALPPGGTVLETISVGAEDVNLNSLFSPSATAGGWTYYSRSNTNKSPGEGAELWRTNGSITEAVANIYPGNSGSSPSAFVATSDRVYFTADDGTHGRELWVTNPANKADTHIVHEHVPGTGGTTINDPGQVANGNVLYYVPANDPVTGAEVWRTDGTEAGTRVVKDITPGPGGFSQPTLFAFRGGVGILRGADIYASSDGTDAGTSRLGAVDGDGYGANTPVVLGDRAYFAGGFTPFGQALWRTDGSPAGTFGLSTAGFEGTGATSGNPFVQSLAVLGSKLVFFGRDPSTNDSGAVKLFVIDTTLPDEVRQTTPPPSTGAPAAGGATPPTTGGGTSTTPGGTTTIPGGTTTPPKRSALSVKKKARLAGTARVGRTLRITRPSFRQTGVKLSFRWSAGGKAIKKQTRSSLKLTRAQGGKRISVTITATKAGFATTKVTLRLTGKVKAAKR